MVTICTLPGCRRPVAIPPRTIKDQPGQYCSKQCVDRAWDALTHPRRRTSMKVLAPHFGDVGITELSCDVCGGPVYLNWSSRDGRDCCSRDCQRKAESMPKKIETKDIEEVESKEVEDQEEESPITSAAATKKAKKSKPAGKATKATKPKAEGPREGSKAAQAVTMLQRKNGATLQELMDRFGWQSHTTAAFLSAGGALTKKFGIVVTSEKSAKGVRTYRIE